MGGQRGSARVTAVTIKASIIWRFLQNGMVFDVRIMAQSVKLLALIFNDFKGLAEKKSLAKWFRI